VCKFAGVGGGTWKVKANFSEKKNAKAGSQGRKAGRVPV
jgi:hypothetical protein